VSILTREETQHLQAAEHARREAMERIATGESPLMIAMHLAEASEGFRLVADEIQTRLRQEARDARARSAT
jgi:hypothetical protein